MQEQPSQRDGGAFITTNCIDLIVDGPFDYTPGPTPPHLLEYFKKMRDKYYGKQDPDGPQEPKPPTEQ